jgi:hypothetical protein
MFIARGSMASASCFRFSLFVTMFEPPRNEFLGVVLSRSDILSNFPLAPRRDA